MVLGSGVPLVGKLAPSGFMMPMSARYSRTRSKMERVAMAIPKNAYRV